MLHPRVLPQVLSQATSEGVLFTMLLNLKGDLLSVSAPPATPEPGSLAAAAAAYAAQQQPLQQPAAPAQPDPKVVGAIASLAWSSYSRAGADITQLFVECDTGKVVVRRVAGKFLLCLVASNAGQFGLMRRKAQLLCEHLESPLTEWSQAVESSAK
eukprot:m51a1_g6702 putative ragulator complex protein lamtor2 isoform x1 (156) ;mRNA; r:98375-99112